MERKIGVSDRFYLKHFENKIDGHHSGRFVSVHASNADEHRAFVSTDISSDKSFSAPDHGGKFMYSSFKYSMTLVSLQGNS